MVAWTPELATATRIARPTAEPACWVVDAMAEAMPWWCASTPLVAVVNIAVQARPWWRLSRMMPGGRIV
ncbi:hypothetical protein [Streptomyces olivaceoviridis]|uniref:Uncharacterized protein n=1 Tax=Streptomyces corchorusii TaxID=1903 RepID=A0A117QB60_STRCK|nr:hypothetical protein AQJ11_33235 [Streptomyces corchorusii]